MLALGTNDAANVFVGSNVGQLERIGRMMSAIGDQPVMWVNVRSLVASGPYAEQNMRLWDEALLEACREYPNMRVYDWAAGGQGRLVHQKTASTSPRPATRERSRLIAQALAKAFPAGGAESKSCLVH